MVDKGNRAATGMESDSSRNALPVGLDHSDSDVPIGNAPPGPKWPIAAWAGAWALWVLFLGAMMISARV